MPAQLTSTLHIVSVVAAIVLLWKGADYVVDGAARIARRLKVSELIIGLTLVAAGTSAPEFAVSIGAALAGQANISVGNIVGSNIFNLGFILGGCAAIRPILTSRALVHRDAVFLFVITLALALFLVDLRLSRWEGIIMAGALVTYIGLLWWRRKPAAEMDGGLPAEQEDLGKSHLGRDFLFFVIGLALVVSGARLLIYGASGLALTFGMSDWTIGVTIVAAGTSAPELVTSLTAVLKGKHGISAGGLVGSDIYNMLGVLGVASIIHPLGIAEAGRYSIALLVGMVLLVLVFMRTGWKVSRPEGLVLLTISALRWAIDMGGLSLTDLIR